MFKNVIVRIPSSKVVDGETTCDKGKPIYEKALMQHKIYIETLKACGVKVHIMEPLEEYPDSCFVEDPAIVTEKFAVVTNPGISSRNGEKNFILEGISPFYNDIEYITNGTLEGGDVLQIDDYFYIGLSSRTNREGAENLIELLQKYGYDGEVVSLKEMFHLKSGVNYIGNNTVLVAGEFIEDPRFDQFKKLEIDQNEMYAANCIRINDFVVMPKDFPKTKAQLIENGFKIKEVPMTEFEKIDGGLSCLSLRF